MQNMEAGMAARYDFEQGEARWYNILLSHDAEVRLHYVVARMNHDSPMI